MKKKASYLLLPCYRNEEQLLSYFFEYTFRTVDCRNVYRLPLLVYLKNEHQANSMAAQLKTELAARFVKVESKSPHLLEGTARYIQRLETRLMRHGLPTVSLQIAISESRYAQGGTALKPGQRRSVHLFNIVILESKGAPVERLKPLFKLQLDEDAIFSRISSGTDLKK